MNTNVSDFAENGSNNEDVATYKPQTKKFRVQTSEETRVSNLVIQGVSNLNNLIGSMTCFVDPTQLWLRSLNDQIDKSGYRWIAKDKTKMKMINIILKQDNESFMVNKDKLQIIEMWARSLIQLTKNNLMEWMQHLGDNETNV